MSEQTNPYQAPASNDQSKPANSIVSGATEQTRVFLGQAAPWMRFLGIVGYVLLGIFVLVGILAGIFGGMLGEAFGGLGAIAGPLMAVYFLVIAVIMYFPIRYLNRMAKKAKLYKLQGEASDLEGVAQNLKHIAKYYGVFTIVLLSTYLAIIVFGAIFAAIGLAAH